MNQPAQLIWNNAGRLSAVLARHGIAGRVERETKGPNATLYEFRASDDVRFERVAYLEKTLCLALHAHSVRVAPVAGKGTIGIEVASPGCEPVLLADVFESEEWIASTAALPLALGVGMDGVPIIADLAEAPHLLIAGATGSGKSVCLNGLILSLVTSRTTKELRLLLIDPKVVEFQGFAGLPHLLVPPVSTGSRVLAALAWLMKEMDSRYRTFGALGVRNISAHNAMVPSAQRLPRIVVVIDELADLMLLAKDAFETGIARLAQLARAAGIHLVVATQRPSVNVITGIIKANLPSRLAFRVVSQVDSRVILDVKGAEALLGKGDALWMGPGLPDLVRLQGCYISDADMTARVSALSVGGSVAYVDAAQKAIASGEQREERELAGAAASLPTPSSLITPALAAMQDYGGGNADLLRRVLRIPAELADAVIELMAEREIVTKGEPGTTRGLLVGVDYD